MKNSHEEVFDPGDMRNMGGLRKTMPVTFWVYMIGTLALAGIVPFAGFWSKDEILLDASRRFPVIYMAPDHCGVLHRLLHGTPDLDGLFRRAPSLRLPAHAEESPLVMTVPLMILAFLVAVWRCCSICRSNAFTISATGWSHTLKEVESLPLNLSGRRPLHGSRVDRHLCLPGYLYGRNPLEGRSGRSAQEIAWARSLPAWKTNGMWMSCINAIIITPLPQTLPFPGGCGRLALLA